ncbi:tuberin isoform X2 [Plodia interpunctella]|uniref:tuberin isoform X2 n=1 Tax=Plodia interpunctella TaxID=58824 RepID=UPI0023677835|nr:tuberin isoform X2 [Plodia interpunctella]
MSSRDRDLKSLQDKLKVFLKKGSSAALPARSELVVSAELARELCRDAPPPRRLRAMKDLADRVHTLRVSEGTVQKLWSLTRDLLEDSSAESRQTALGLQRAVLEAADAAPADELTIMRTIYLRFLRETHPNHPPEDTQLRFKFLHTLTNTGKNIKCFEEEIGSFLLEWLPQVQEPALVEEFLQLVINVVKFNATYLDEEIVHAFVNHACHLAVYSEEMGVVLWALALLEAVVGYSLLPRAALRTFVSALCRCVNLERYCQPSWKLMRIVLGADIGHAALSELVELLHGADNAGLQRGAVFYINMALWGPCRVRTLHVSLLAVLPAFLKALEGQHSVVTYEVLLALQSLVARAPASLHAAAWDVLLAALTAIVHHDRALEPPNEMIHSRLHALLTALEQLLDAGQYCGEVEALLDLIDLVGQDRPESSVLRLVELRTARLAGGRAGAAAALAAAERYIRQQSRLAVRTHALDLILAYVKRTRSVYGEELVELVAVPVLAACAADAAAGLRAAAARALAELARLCVADPATDLIDLLEKILNRPFEIYVTDVPVPADEGGDLQLAVAGLVQLFHDKMYSPPASHAARCLLVLLDHLDLHYKRPALFQNHPEIRLKIFELLFGLRVNEFCCVGFCYDSLGAPVWGAAAQRLRPVCSPHLLVEPCAVRAQPQQPHKDPAPGTCVLPAGRCARALSCALTLERDWAVQCCVLRALPELLHARAPAVGRRAQDLDLLASTLQALVQDRSAKPQDRKPLMSEVHGAALPALAALAPYHAFLEPQTQQRIVRCLLKFGMQLRTAQPFINAQPYIYALTIFTLETRDTMVKMLPEVLLDLSKISDTKAIASPMLEFLSTLTRLPRVFASFVEDQYMSVFAILLPYTNPSRYNQYVVSLAHHVIAAWFLKCRLCYRRNFVQFIIHGLHNYIIMPFEEQLQYRSNKSLRNSSNEDSSNRQRSSSLVGIFLFGKLSYRKTIKCVLKVYVCQGSKVVSRATLGGRTGGTAGGGAGGGASAAFHVELTETCVDLLTRYASTRCSVKPQRADIADFLFSGGQSMTWVVGHKVVTITTSGCVQNAAAAGPCERCAALSRAVHDGADAAQTQSDSDDAGASTSSNQLHVNNPPEIKRYSKHSLSRSAETSSSSLSISDAGHSTRQNSSENNKCSDPMLEAIAQITQRLEKLAKEVDVEQTTPRPCPCWSAGWAELHVRTPTGDVSWLLRAQNHESWDQMLEWALQDLAGSVPPASVSSQDQTESPRSRSGSGGARDPQDLHKSSSDSVVSGERRPPHAATHCIVPPQPLRSTTQPINIPSSPQRQSSSSTTDDDDMLLIVPEGKSRHPVRRSNSSPEMSSSWKLSRDELEPDHDEDMILLPSCEPAGTMSMAMHASKKAAKKSDMRVSCEAIPEEMSGTSPLAAARTQPAAAHHPHLMTYNSDPGAVEAPATSQPAHHQLQKTASDSTVPSSSALKPPRPPAAGAGAGCSTAEAGGAAAARDRDDLPPLSRSRRSHTISVMSPTRRHRENVQNRLNAANAASSPAAGSGAAVDAGMGLGGGGMTPSFLFLQLYHNLKSYPLTGAVPGEPQPPPHPLLERPLRVSGVQHERSIKSLDLVPPVDTYKVGVLYVGPGQHDNEVLILKNTFGSVRYSEFLAGLGSLVSLLEEPDPELFLNLERGGRDGTYTYVWRDDIMQVLYHVATAMPTSAKDPTCNEKRKYIGNDLVSIVYNDSGHEFNIQTIKGQANLCIIVVEPTAHGMCVVQVRSRDERVRALLPHLDVFHVSLSVAPRLARQLALHCSLAAQIAQSLRLGAPPAASNALERLRIIKRLRRRLEAERLAAAARPQHMTYGSPEQAQRIAIDDFNDYA